MWSQGRTARTVTRIAARQNGNVSRVQLLEAGVAPTTIRRLVQRGWLWVRHRGVYGVGPRRRDADAAYAGAVLAGGDGALLYGLAADWLLGLVKGAAPEPEVLTLTERRIAGLRTRRRRSREPVASTKVRGIPVIAVPEALVAAAAELAPDALARACHEAGVRYGTTPRGRRSRSGQTADGQGRGHLASDHERRRQG